MIKLKNISKTYVSDKVETKALRDVSLEIEAGEYVAIMGASGSGKTTLLNIIGGMDSATSGEYIYGDINVTKLSLAKLHEFRKNSVSFIFQNFCLMKYYTVFENVEMPLLSKKISKSERRKIVKECLDKVGISDLKNKRPTHISGGQQQRCAIARALASGNELLLADEPTGSLDKACGEEILGIFDELKKMGKTIIMITHDLDVAKRADRIIKLSDGNVVSV